MKIVFIGASKFGLRTLEVCNSLPNITVVGVVTMPKKFTINYRPGGVTNVLHADVSIFANAQNIPVKFMKQTMNEPGLLDTVSKWQPDAFLVSGWYHIIPKAWRQLAPAYGMHASLLPDYSGGAPLVWAMINGETSTGITLFQMDDGIDSGPIAGQKKEAIYPNDTIASLYNRIEMQGVELLQETLPDIARGALKLKPQDHSKRRIMPQRGPEDGLIDWSDDAKQIERFVRAQTRPYPGAFSMLKNKPLHIWQASAVRDVNSESIGMVCRQPSGEYFVGCGNGALHLHEVSYETKNYLQPNLDQLFGLNQQIL